MMTNYLATATRVLNLEADAIRALVNQLSGEFGQACDTMLHCPARIVVTGMGKSGHIAKKISATLASTGTPSFFMHPGEASHGDLGMITPDDVVLALSNSGETQEILAILPVLKRKGVTLISMTGHLNSSLAEKSDVHLQVSVDEEACPLNLAPTSSTTAALAMGDALAVALLEAKGFTSEDFALSHPGGNLGKRLLLVVEEIMHQGPSLPVITESTIIRSALVEISKKGLGMAIIVNDSGHLIGIFTDGDLRRALDKNIDVHSTQIGEVMTRNPQTIRSGMLAEQALNLMEERSINGVVVVDKDNYPIGALNMLDLVRAGVM